MPDGSKEPVGRSIAAPWVQVAATAIHQTANTLEMIRGMLVASPAIEDYSIDVGKTIIQFSDGRPGKIEPVTSNSETLEGGRPTFAVLDETHLWHETNGGHKVFRVIGRNLGKNPGGLARFVESTNAYNPAQDSVAQRTHEAVLAGSRGILYDCLEASPSVDLGNVEALREALIETYGDSVWVDLDRVIDEIQDPRTPASDAFRFYLNQIAATADTWIEKWAWDACRQEDDPLTPKDQIALGFDGSKSYDGTALVASRLRDGHLFLLGLWEPDGSPDWEVDVLAVDARVAEVFKTYRVAWMYADPSFWRSEVGHWAVEFGDDIVFEYSPNRETKMSEAVERFHTDVMRQALAHDGNRDLTRHIANARTRETRQGYVIQKESKRSRKKIDAAVASILAHEARADAIADGRLKRRKKIRVL
jgi:phage terminase large subunit-like protein